MSPSLRRRSGSIPRKGASPSPSPTPAPPPVDAGPDAAATPVPPPGTVEQAPVEPAPVVPGRGDEAPVVSTFGDLVPPTDPDAWEPLLAGVGADLMPSRPPGPTAPDRRARRSRSRRVWILAAAAAAVVVIAGVAVVWQSGGSSGSDAGASARARRAAAARRAVRRRASTTTTTEVGVSPTSASTTTTSVEVATTTPSAAVPVVSPSAGSGRDDGAFGGTVIWTEDPGACRYDPGPGQAEDAGMLRNTGADDASVDVNVTWTDGSQELSTTSTLVYVAAGTEEPWSLTQFLDSAPSAIRCSVTLS